MAKKAYTIEPAYVPVEVTIRPTDSEIVDEIAIVWSGNESESAMVKIGDQPPLYLSDDALEWLRGVGIQAYFDRLVDVIKAAKSK